MAVTVSELYLSLGLELKPKGRSPKRGEELCGPCPSCGGKDRFLIWPEQNDGLGSYSCSRGCGAAGDTIQFLRDFQGMDFFEAKKAAGLATAPRPRTSVPRPPARRAEAGITEAPVEEATTQWRVKATNFAAVCHERLLQENRWMEWLSARGLPEKAVRAFGLGWNAGDGKNAHIMRPRSIWGLPDLPPKKEGEKGKKNIWLPRGLVIPFRGEDGRVSRLRIRRPEEDRSSTGISMPYYVIPGSDMTPFWMPQRASSLPIGICCVAVESELDALALSWAAGDVCAVIGLMTAKVRSLPPSHMRRLSACARILVATDFGDEPDMHGKQAGAEGWEIWKRSFAQARRWPCVQGKDPGEMFAAGVDLRLWVLAGLPEDLAARTLGGAEQDSAAPEAAAISKHHDAPRAVDADPTAVTSETPISAPVDPEQSSRQSTVIPEGVLRLLGALREFPFTPVLKADGGVCFECPNLWRTDNWDLYGELTDLVLSPEVLNWLDSRFPGGGPVSEETLSERISPYV